MSLIHSPNISRNGLILHHDTANLKSYPGSGTTIIDLSGKGNGGSFSGSPVFDANNKGSIAFTSNGYIVLPVCSQLFPLVYHTLEAWVKSPGVGAGMATSGVFGITYGLIVQLVPSGYVSYYAYTTDSGGSPTLFAINSSPSVINVFDNKWHHVVCTRDTSLVSIYIDGQLMTTGANGGTWSGSNIWSAMNGVIGKNPNNSTYFANGNIGNCKIYNRALSAAEITQNFEALRGRYGV